MLNYVGRFAPSPTGPLHLGSLVTAMASYLDAKVANGHWLLRMEDIDYPRNVDGASEWIRNDLFQLGFIWDGEIQYQSKREYLYQAALEEIRGNTFRCVCSRTEQVGLVYDGRCRDLQIKGDAKAPSAVRLQVDGKICWQDRSSRIFEDDLESTCGDFVLYRKDKLWAYQLAVVVDDAAQGVTHVVRGEDLIASTSRQIYLQQKLGLPRPSYWHVPVVLNSNGEKLSKQTGATALNTAKPVAQLLEAWRYLSPITIEPSSVEQFWVSALQAFEPPLPV
jgi:glutamyl-Q tRNA(Asp) synthetase